MTLKNQKKTIVTGLAVMSVMLSVLATNNETFAQESIEKVPSYVVLVG
ncbi:MAG: hypothetical protein OEM18_04570 [Nitrosopumilus sp.]|nr:hypothetical protein [Nitrosopumilus sp.]MDH3502569.1 hypothetical protein [Nitrosopumilus sp.]